MKFKKAPRTKWRFVSGPVAEDMYDFMHADSEALDCLLDDLSDTANDESAFEEEVGG